MSDFFGVTHVMGAILFGEDYTVPTVKTPIFTADDVLSSYAGTYEILPGVTLQITGKDGGLVVTSGKAQSRFLPESETTFFREESGDTITFPAADSGEAHHLILRQEDIETTARRV